MLRFQLYEGCQEAMDGTNPALVWSLYHEGTYANKESMPFAETLILLLSGPCDVRQLARTHIHTHTDGAKVPDRNSGGNNGLFFVINFTLKASVQ